MQGRQRGFRWWQGVAVVCLVFNLAAPALAQVASGYSEYYVPGSEDAMSLALRSLGPTPTDNTHALIAITAWADDITIYYDHWEDGITFDPVNPETTYDEKFTLATIGTLLTLDNTPVGGISVPRVAPLTDYYDGGDRIYVVGSAVTVTRVSWLEARGRAIQAVAWEIYPVKPQLTTYILPFGENLSAAFPDFLRTFVVIQATAADTTFSVDLDGDGTADPLDQNFDGDTADGGDTASVTLQAGESFFLGNVAANPNPMPRGALATVNSGAVVQGSSTLQVKFIVGDPAANYETRGISAFPRGYWTKDYYAPVGDSTARATDLFLYNPNAGAITVNWETQAGTGSFSIGSEETVSYVSLAGQLPVGGGVYLKANDVFWGVSTIDSTGQVNEWAYSLLPSTLLYQEHYLGWAPGGADGDDSGVFLTVVQDNTRVFVDYDNDGTADQTYTLNRLQTQYITDTGDGDLSGARFWATAPFTMSYGQNPDTAPAQATSGDLGYVAIPGTDFIAMVLGVDKSVNPVVVPAAGGTSTFTLTVDSQKYTVDTIRVMDILAAGWTYTGPTAITLADMTTVATAPTVTPAGAALPAPFTGNCPAGGGACLTWDGTVLQSMTENQQITISFAATAGALASGTLSQNRVRATGSRTVGGVTQTFNATDFAYNVSGATLITKTSSATDPVSPGDAFTYTVQVQNPGAIALTGVSLYDALPAGVTYVPGSGSSTCQVTRNVRDEFALVLYSNNGPNNTDLWAGDWAETDTGGAANGLVQVTAGGQLRLSRTANVRDEFAAVAYGNNGPNNTANWAGDWAETDSLGGGAAGGLALVTGAALRLGLAENVRDQFGAAAYNNNGPNNTANWAGDWAETDSLGGGATGGLLLVTGGVLVFRTVTSGTNANDPFTTDNTYGGGTGTWSGAWTEQNDGTNTYDTGTIRLSNGNNRLEIIQAQLNDAIYRTATVTGATAVTINAAVSDNGIGGGETLVAEYSVDGGGYVAIDTLDGAVGWGGGANPFPFTINGFTGNAITLRFRAGSNWNNAGDIVRVDTIDISFSVPAVGTAIQRTADLTGATSATLNFTAAAANLEAADTLVIEAATSAAGPFTVLATYAAGTPDVTNPINITGYLSAATTIQFRVTGGYNAIDETFSFDNVNISYTRTPTATQRTADLSVATVASLNFTTAVANLEAADTLVVEAAASAAGPFTTLATYAAGAPNVAPPYNLTPYLSAATTVRFRITGGYTETNETFSVDNVDITYSAAAAQIQRTADLTGAASASLSFSAAAANLEAADTLVIEAATSAAGPFTALATYAAGVPTPAGPYNLGPYIASTTTIRFRTSGGYDVNNETLSFDNVNITYQTNKTGSAPDFLSSAMGCTIPAGGSLTLTFDVTADNPFPSGVASITNTAATTSVQLPIAISASVTNTVLVPSALSASVGGRVWFDADGDGVQDLSGEPGLVGVEVTLKDLYGNAVPGAVMLTDGFGNYNFPGIAPGTGYYVEATDFLPAGLSQSYPAGRTDNRTGSFDLAAGQVSSSADLGYQDAPGTASFGDQAWVDADGDSSRDAGEIGLGGVTLTLYRDIDGNGTLDTGVDTLVGTDTSQPDGTYRFTGLAATGTEDYFITSSTPTGYVPTGTLSYLLQNVSGSVLTADFGFAADTGGGYATYSITDRVWVDGDGDGSFDAGESGIAGVTVELLDESLDVLGTTITAADGTFTFSGVAGLGADYTLNINDTGGMLTDYYGTTAFAVAGKRAEPNLTASIDRVATPPPSFGFRVLRSVGDTVFSDIDGDGTLDPGDGDSGMAGVVVSLFTDLDGDGVIEAGDTLVGSVTTDAAGQYLFSGLADGDYIVSIPLQAGYTFNNVVPDSDGAAAGIQNQAAISGGASYLDADFGFEPDAPRNVSGTIWEDADADGVIDAGEFGIAGVTLEVLNAGAVVVASLATDAAGGFSATGLAAGAYTVRIIDFGGVLTDYDATFERSESITSPFDNLEAVDLTGGSAVDVNFGFKKPPPPTSATIASFTAFVADGAVVVQWRTTLEVGTAGFHLLRRNPDSGAFERLNDRLLPGLIVHPQGGTYRFRDETAPQRGTLTYVLVEVEHRGALRTYGPYTVSLAGKAARSGAAGSLAAGAAAGTLHPFERFATKLPTSRQESAGAVSVNRQAAADVQVTTIANTLKIVTRDKGLHYLPADQIAALLGLDVADTANLISSRGFNLASRGTGVRYLPAADGQGLFFHAQQVASIYTGENVYWLTLALGQTMTAASPGVPGRRATFFQETRHAEEDRYPLPAYFQDPQADFWCWDYAFADYPGYETRSFAIPAPGAAGLGEATLTVRLLGGSDTAAPSDHHAVIAWNGVPVAETQWDGTTGRELVIPIDPASVLAGDNTLELTALLDGGVDYSFFFLDSFDLSYRRLYQADGDELWFTAPAAAAITVGGFSTPDILLLDLTIPKSPVQAVGTTVTAAADGTYQLSYSTPSAAAGRRSYLATTLQKARPPVDIVAGRNAGLRNPANRADYVLIAPAPLLDAAQALADYRTGSGLETLVVSLEAVYDEFNQGIASPEAIRSFLRAASAWDRPLRYATLVGRGTLDYQDFQGFGDNLVPTLMAPTPYGLVVSDTRIADFVGDDGVPDIALGRLPVVSSEELLDYLARTQAHEAAAPDPRRVLLVADNPDAGGSFTTDSDTVAALVPADHVVDRVYLTSIGAAAGKQAIVNALNEGVAVFNYIGHAGIDALADEGVFASADVPSLTNVAALPVFLAMTCSVGNFGIPGYPSLGEAMLLSGTGGALATFAPSGLSDNAEAVLLNEALFRAAFVAGEKIVGDVVGNALREHAASGPPAARIRHLFNLLGEPVCRLP